MAGFSGVSTRGAASGTGSGERSGACSMRPGAIYGLRAPEPCDAPATVPRQIFTTANAPISPLFAQAVKAGPFVLVSGTAGLDPNTGRLAGDTIQAQAGQALANCKAILEAAGAGLEDVVEVGVLLTRPTDFDGLNDEYTRWFPSDPPTRYVARLGPEPPGVLVSIRMTAHVP
jgi:enamine deaminase RidA (YjgF/YER057c/UK114 family)